MDYSKKAVINSFIIILLFLAAVTAFSFDASAASVPDAYGQINSYDGAILRKSSSTKSSALCVLPDNTGITIHKEVFNTKTSISKKKKWFYVTANGTKGYVRADLVDNIGYDTVIGSIKSNTVYRSGAGVKMKKAGSLSKDSKVTIILKSTPVRSACGSSRTWYKIREGGKYYYVPSGKVKLAGNTLPTAFKDAEFEAYLVNAGFPVSYRNKLSELHRLHPDWVFTGYKTSIIWKNALSKQTTGGRSLVSGSLPSSYRDGSKQYEKGWFKANSKVVAYYMDPRNFLNENSIYMFEDLSYRPEYQTSAVIKAILAPTKLPGCGFKAGVFVKAAKASNVSPVFLASRARQETGGGRSAISGKKILGKKVYNPFNIGAFGGTDPVYNGLVYAYGKGWTTPLKATKGGAKVLAKNYIKVGQNTVYYQKFNVRNGEVKAGTHQYMTNITAPYTEALSTRSSYAKYGILDQPLVFEIPIYEGMPASTKLP